MPVDFLTAALDHKRLRTVLELADGLHVLASQRKSGALDYVRAQYLKASDEDDWQRARADETLDDLEALVSKSKRVCVFGSPYTKGLGVHDVHMNQGDPAGSQWFAANGVWQDGGVLIETKTKLRGFFTKFVNQTLDTDDQGNPE